MKYLFFSAMISESEVFNFFRTIFM